MPNALAYLMLALWPVVAAVLFRRLPVERAVIWTILAGYLVLPPIAAFNLPAVPDLDKHTLPGLLALAGVVATRGGRGLLWPASWPARALIVLYVLGPLGTVATNADPQVFGPVVQPGLRPYDSLAIVAERMVTLIPFLLARRVLASGAALRDLAVALVLGGLAYSLPVLIEVRLSPQLNVWIYGFFQHDFGQMMRQGGFRPIVFLQHGIWVAVFMVTTLGAAAALLSVSGPDARPRLIVTVLWLAAMVVLCKTMAALAYAAMLLPLILATPRAVQMRVALALAAAVVFYPVLRGAGLVPLETILDFAGGIDAARAGSLRFRIDNEEMLLAHAAERPWFGWGGYSRNLVPDPATGRILTVPDGRWVIAMGMYGWAGYLAEFGLLALPVLWLWRAARRAGGAGLSPLAVPLGLIHAVTLVDLLPNATLIPLSWLVAGALLGHSERVLAGGREGVATAEVAPRHARARTVL